MQPFTVIMPPSNPLPISHVSAELYPSSSFTPSQHVKVSQVAPVPQIPKSGTYTLVRVLSTSLNPVDYKLASLPFPLPQLMIGRGPHVPGLDFVGRVWSTNDERFKGGDIVWGMLNAQERAGAAAGYVVISKTGWCDKIPEGWLEMSTRTGRELEELGCFPICGFTALQSLLMADLGFSRSWKGKGAGREEGKGGKVFVNGGSGGVGTFTVQMAKHAFGCESVVASCSGANVELVKSLGADEVIDYRSQNVVEALQDWSKRNGGQQFDVIIDNVGTPEIYWPCHNYLKPGSEGGRYVLVGLGAGIKGVMDLTQMTLLPGFLGGGKRPFGMMFLMGVPADQRELAGKWMVEGKVKTVIEDGNKFELQDIQKAFEKLKGGRTRGKISVQVTEDGS